VKTQIGHSEAASGIAAIIKATLIVETGLIPPTIGVENLNPNSMSPLFNKFLDSFYLYCQKKKKKINRFFLTIVKFDEWKVEVAREVTPWPARLTSKICRVSVNSFG
jgi:hypothetical protein